MNFFRRVERRLDHLEETTSILKSDLIISNVPHQQEKKRITGDIHSVLATFALFRLPEMLMITFLQTDGFIMSDIYS